MPTRRAHVSLADLSPELRRQLQAEVPRLGQPAPPKRPSKRKPPPELPALPKGERERMRCSRCGQVTVGMEAARRHINSLHGGGRLELLVPAPEGP